VCGGDSYTRFPRVFPDPEDVAELKLPAGEADPRRLPGIVLPYTIIRVRPVYEVFAGKGGSGIPTRE